MERCEACDPDTTPLTANIPRPWPTHELTRVLLTLLDASRCHGSLLEGRASDGEFWPLPAPWRAYLLALPLSAVHEAERRGLQHSNISGMPADLSDLCECVRTASRAAGRVDGDDGDAPSSAAFRGVTASKAEQVRRLRSEELLRDMYEQLSRVQASCRLQAAGYRLQATRYTPQVTRASSSYRRGAACRSCV